MIETDDIINSLPWPAVVLNDQRRIQFANERAEDALMMRSKTAPVAHIIRQPILLQKIETAFETGQPQLGDMWQRGFANSAHYQVHLRPFQGQRKLLLIFMDRSEQTAKDQQRSDFVANVSHELRSPLTAIMGFIETLQNNAQSDPDAAVMFLDLMAAETSRMNVLVTDLLSLSRVEAQQAQPPKECHCLSEIVREAAQRFVSLEVGQGAEITFEIENDLPPIPCDPAQIQQVVTNLMENAIRYGGDTAKIDVNIASQTRDPILRAPVQVMTLIDHGPGIAPQHIPRLTERFFRVDDHRTRAAGGTGLGLAIVKHIIQRHRGRLEISSQVGVGTSVEVILPNPP